MLEFIRLTRLLISYCVFVLFMIVANNYDTAIYIVYQAKGQVEILISKEPISAYVLRHNLSNKEKENFILIEEVKRYSIDSLGYLPTDNFTEVYDQKNSPVLWVITACKPYELLAYEWTFPIVGRVSYKGFFKEELAKSEYNRMVIKGYDVDLRQVSAWSTLGWFKDPILSSMLKRKKGSLCNLLFHELFHATLYAPNAINFNENIASFIADKATIMYLKQDTATLNEYVSDQFDSKTITSYMFRKSQELRKYYSQISELPTRSILKLVKLNEFADSSLKLPLKEHIRGEMLKREILEQKNALFIDYEQYDSMQDTLERIFNKIYKGDLKKMVQDLKQNQTIIKFDN